MSGEKAIDLVLLLAEAFLQASEQASVSGGAIMAEYEAAKASGRVMGREDVEKYRVARDEAVERLRDHND